jgi:translation elongation factor EF-G
MGGDSRSAIVVKFLDMVVQCLPSPVDVNAVKGIDPKTEEKLLEKLMKMIHSQLCFSKL